MAKRDELLALFDLAQLAEVDLNPFLLSPEPTDCRIVDVRVRLAG